MWPASWALKWSCFPLSRCLRLSPFMWFTVGVLNVTLDLAALVLLGVVDFLDSEVVLFPVVSG